MTDRLRTYERITLRKPEHRDGATLSLLGRVERFRLAVSIKTGVVHESTPRVIDDTDAVEVEAYYDSTGKSLTMTPELEQRKSVLAQANPDLFGCLEVSAITSP